MRQSIASETFLLGELLNSEPTGRLLSRLRFGGSVLEISLSEVGRWGFAHRQYLNGRFKFSVRFDTEGEALAAAAAIVACRVDEGWVEDNLSMGIGELSNRPIG